MARKQQQVEDPRRKVKRLSWRVVELQEASSLCFEEFEYRRLLIDLRRTQNKLHAYCAKYQAAGIDAFGIRNGIFAMARERVAS